MKVYCVISRTLLRGEYELQNIFSTYEAALEWAETMNEHSEDSYSVEEWTVI